MDELETEAVRTRDEIATQLREVAEQLEDGGPVEIGVGGSSVTLEPTEPITLKLEGESDWQEGDGETKESIELELVWRRAVAGAEDAALDAERAEPGA